MRREIQTVRHRWWWRRRRVEARKKRDQIQKWGHIMVMEVRVTEIEGGE